MKKAVVFLAHNRPHYMSETLASWAKARGNAEWDFHAFLDPSNQTSVLVDQLKKFEVMVGKPVNIFIPENNLGCSVSHFHCLERMYETLGYDFVVLAEDDIIVSDDVLEYFSTLSKKYALDEQVLSINTHVYGTKSGKYITRDSWFNPWVWGSWKNRWTRYIKPTFDKNYSSGEDGAPTGWDCNLDLRVVPKYNLVCLFPPTSLSKHIGVHGRNSDEGSYNNLLGQGAACTFSQHNEPWRWETYEERAVTIDAIYNFLLQRQSDEGGRAFYTNTMYSFPEIIELIKESGEYTSLTANITRKVNIDQVPQILSFQGEFSQELMLFLPFVNYLFANKLLEGKTLEIQHGMECFYKHINCNKIRKNLPRKHMSVHDCPEWLPWNSEFIVSSHPQMLFIDHRTLFKDVADQITLPNDKPLLIIHNKHNIEWDTGGPVNFINGLALDSICSELKEKYQIIYIRHGINKLPGEYNRDGNTILDTDEDRVVLKKHPEVILFDNLFSQYKHLMDYNTFKSGLYAKCYKFISSQGGGSYQIACYSNSQMHVLHVRGEEKWFAYDHGLYKHASAPCPDLTTYADNDSLIQCIDTLKNSTSNEVANFFWHGPITECEVSCIQSAVRSGFHVNVWSYTNIQVEGAVSRDAREILPEDHLTKYKQKHPFDNNGDGALVYSSIAAFSDAFRYKLLYEQGGWWFDCDQYCIKPVSDFIKLKQQRSVVAAYEGPNQWVSCAVMHLSPEISKMCWELLQQRCVNNNYTFDQWAMIGPDIIHTICTDNDLSGQILPHTTFFPINWTDMSFLIDKEKKAQALTDIEKSCCVALWNSQLSQKYNIKNNIPIGSLLEHLVKG